jgi:hypothetical protein
MPDLKKVDITEEVDRPGECPHDTKPRRLFTFMRSPFWCTWAFSLAVPQEVALQQSDQSALSGFGLT